MKNNIRIFLNVCCVFFVFFLGCSSIHSKKIEPEELKKIFKTIQSLAKENHGYPCYSKENTNTEVLGWLLVAGVKDITSYEYPPSWANKNEKDMLSMIIRLKGNERAVFSVDIKLVKNRVECYDLSRIYF